MGKNPFFTSCMERLKRGREAGKSQFLGDLVGGMAERGDIGVNLGWEVCFLGGNFLMSS